jgi:hypothetical protein
MSIHLTRAQRRQMQKLADRVDRVTQADRLFFERRPDRMHRVRLASQAEIGQQELLEGKPLFMPPGCRVFCIVRNIAPGVRMRLFTYGLEGSETDLSEAWARAIFEKAATPQAWKIEAQLRAAAEAQA